VPQIKYPFHDSPDEFIKVSNTLQKHAAPAATCSNNHASMQHQRQTTAALASAATPSQTLLPAADCGVLLCWGVSLQHASIRQCMKCWWSLQLPDALLASEGHAATDLSNVPAWVLCSSSCLLHQSSATAAAVRLMIIVCFCYVCPLLTMVFCSLLAAD
jgi:hypothetical protein